MRSLLLMLTLIACGAQNPAETDVSETDAAESDSNVAEDAPTADAPGSAETDVSEVDAQAPPSLANVVAVEVQGEGLAVTLQSPDTGCERYANWWEVVTDDGLLVYRRILGHSHVDEQPFTRSGGPVSGDGTLIVRAHMAPGGYGGVAFRGTLAEGFSAAPDIGAEFAAELEDEAPVPSGCAF